MRVDNGLLAACLAEAHPVEVRGREVVVAFAEHDTFNRKMADGREHRATVDDALRDLAGSALRVVFELRELEEQSGAAAALRGRARGTLQDGVRRRGDRPRRSATRRAGGSALMPQPPNMQQMLKQVQKMQQDMEAAQEALKHEEVEASAGGGMVTVKVSGDLVIKSIVIAPEAIDPDDPELLQDMVLAAVNEALRAAQELQQTRLGGLAGGMDLGSLGLPGF